MEVMQRLKHWFYNLTHPGAKKKSVSEADTNMASLAQSVLSQGAVTPAGSAQPIVATLKPVVAQASKRIDAAIHKHDGLGRGTKFATPAIHVEKLDASIVKNGRIALAVRRKEGKDLVLASFRLTRFGMERLLECIRNVTNDTNVQVIMGSYHYYAQSNGELQTSNVNPITNGQVIKFPGLGKIIIGTPHAQHHALYGEVLVEVDSTFSPNEAPKAIAKMFDLLGVQEVMAERSTESQKREKMMAMFQILYPAQSSQLKVQKVFDLPLDALKAKMIALAPDLKKKFNSELDRMYLQEVRPKQHEWAYRGMKARLQKEGAVGLMAGTGSLESAVRMLQTGALSSHDRFVDHRIIQGASSEADLKTGGGRYVFTRVITKELAAQPIDDFPFSGKVQILYDLDVAERVCYMHKRDLYGSKAPGDYDNRKDIVTAVRALDKYSLENEMMIQGRIPPEKIRRLVVQNKTEKDALILLLKQNNLVVHGKINGVHVNEFIQVSNTFNTQFWQKSFFSRPAKV